MRPAKRQLEVLGRVMAYVEVGEGDPIVLLHGNPTSSYLWRNVLPHLAHLGRCIAPDLIGMGDSDKLPASGPSSYAFSEHRRHLDALLEGLGVQERVAFVLHDWGSALGFDWANRHREAVAAIAYMEAIVAPLTWDDLPEPVRTLFAALRSPAGEQMVLRDDVFVEQVLPGGVMRALSDDEMAEYRRPFTHPGEDRRPTLTWPRQVPLNGEPDDVTEIVEAYAVWLGRSLVPKLFVSGDPGAVLTGRPRDLCRTWPAQREVAVRGLHFLQEDSPDDVGGAIAAWLAGLGWPLRPGRRGG
jgi:haloalkane dehalogenase